MPFAHFDAVNGRRAELAELVGLAVEGLVVLMEGLPELIGQAVKAGDMATGLLVGVRR